MDLLLLAGAQVSDLDDLLRQAAAVTGVPLESEPALAPELEKPANLYMERWPRFEDFLVDPDGGGIVTASPLQRALTYVFDNEEIPPELWLAPMLPEELDPEGTPVAEAFGWVKPRTALGQILIVCGIRCGKSAMAAMEAIRCTQRLDLDTPVGRAMLPGEIPRVFVVSRTVQMAQRTFGYIKGLIRSRAVLSALLVEEPKADSLKLYHPSGRPIEIAVVPASVAGASLVGCWIAGLIFEEAARMASEAEGKVNIDENVRFAQGRMLPGANIVYITSPVGHTGYIYELFTANWKNDEQRVAVVKARGDWMNPVEWTPEEQERLLKRDPDAHHTDFLANFADLDENLLTAFEVESAMRREPLELPPVWNKTYTAVMDPATRRNAWTLGITESDDNLHHRVALCMEWVPKKGAPLRPQQVFREMKPILDRYGVESVLTDQYAADAMRDIALIEGIGLSMVTLNETMKKRAALSFKARLSAGYIELPAVPHLREDLINVRRTMVKGNVGIKYPETNDGRHCDYAAMLFMLCGSYVAENEKLEKLETDPDKLAELEEDEEAEQAANDSYMYSEDDYGTGTSY